MRNRIGLLGALFLLSTAPATGGVTSDRQTPAAYEGILSTGQALSFIPDGMFEAARKMQRETGRPVDFLEWRLVGDADFAARLKQEAKKAAARGIAPEKASYRVKFLGERRALPKSDSGFDVEVRVLQLQSLELCPKAPDTKKGCSN